MKFFDWFMKDNNDSPEEKEEKEATGKIEFSGLSQNPFESSRQKERSTDNLETLKEMAGVMRELENISRKAYYKMLASTIELAYLDIAQKRFSEQQKS